ncbi:MAG: argininosuccinate synthase [Anaerolineaceae bacterium]|nr:argininosuccinate synthase [Anaerolineaceae bacterium]
MSEKINKVLLAYSGGLDTSAIIPWLIDTYHCEVICYCANVGQEEELDHLEDRAKASGATKLIIDDLVEPLCKDYIWPLVKSGAIYERKYYLGTSIARPIVAKRLVEVAQQEHADAIAHGCTGKGNDQVRLENGIHSLDPSLKVIAPWRIWDFTSREDLLNYLDQKGIGYPDSAKNPKLFSRDRNIWHISHEGGPIENIDAEPDESFWVLTVSPEQAPDKPEYVEIEFEAGEAVAVNGKKMTPAQIVHELNVIGGRNGIGRCDMVENRLVGMKSHGLYETPGGTILCTAHSELEFVTCDRETMHFKDTVSPKWAELVYNGQWFSPLVQSLNVFFDETNKWVTGSIKLKLYKGNIIIAGRKPKYNLYNENFASFGDVSLYDHKDATGFISCFSLPGKVIAMMKKQTGLE